MNKTTLTITALFIIGIAAFTSCKKSSDTPVTPIIPLTSAENLAGTWTIVQQYMDYNVDGIQDANELVSDTSLAHRVYKFATAGDFTYSYYGSSATGTWHFLNNNGYLQITDSLLSPPTISSIVLLLTDSQMELKDTINAAHGGITWTYFQKQ